MAVELPSTKNPASTGVAANCIGSSVVDVLVQIRPGGQWKTHAAAALGRTNGDGHPHTDEARVGVQTSSAGQMTESQWAETSNGGTVATHDDDEEPPAPPLLLH